jgi:two-component system LytT family sensor kinase
LKIDRKIFIVLAHLAAWNCFFSLPYIFSDPPRDTSQILLKHRTVLLIVLNVYLLAFYYLNTLLLIPKFLFNTKWPIYIAIVAALFAGFVYAPRPITFAINGTSEQIIQNEKDQEFKQRFGSMKIIDSTLTQSQKDSIKARKDSLKARRDSSKMAKKNQPPKNSVWAFKGYFPGSFVVFLLVFSIGLCIAIMQRWRMAERTKEEVQHEKTNTELSFLKSQVNPHFFFNTLNNIYSLAVVQSEKTAPTVMRLSSIMRYILTETQTDKVPLENEIDFVKNFIDLQLVRLTDKVKVNFHTEGDISNKQIAPLLFISFVENAFKYGVSTKEASEINILFKVEGNKIQFNVVNTIVKADNGILDTTGIGINNAKRRLELLYPGSHTLKVLNDGNIFEVQLEITTV